MKSLLCLALAAIAFPTLAADPPGKPALAFGIEAGKIHEECMRLDAGEKRVFDWKSNAAVDFNVHYHEGAEVFFPVKRDATRGERDTFTAKIAQDYCWMWTAKDRAAKVEGRIERAK